MTEGLTRGADLDREYVWIARGNSAAILHTAEDCGTLRRANHVRIAPTERYPNNAVCRICTGESRDVYNTDRPRNTCRECGGPIRDGECGFCTRFEAVVGGD